MSAEHWPDGACGEEAKRESAKRLAKRLAETEEERDELRRRLSVASRSSRKFTKSARATLSGRHGLENELRRALARAHSEREEAEDSLRRVESFVGRLGGGAWEAEASPERGIEKFTFVSSRFEETMGFPRSRWLHSADFWFEAMHPEDRERVRRAYADAAREGEEGRVEFRAFGADGRMVWIEDFVHPIIHNGGPRLRGVMVDVSARRRAENALRDSEERLRAIYDGTYEYIGLLAPDGTVLDANRASLEFGGDEREDVVGLPFWETAWFANTPGASKKLRGAISRAAEGEFVRYEAPLRRPSGETIVFDFSLHPIRGEKSGEVAFIVPEWRDISERKRSEEAVRRSEERFRLLFEQATDAAFVHDLEGNITQANRQARESLGYTRGELVGLRVSDIEMNASSDGFEEIWSEVLRSGNPVVVEGMNRRKDGSEFPVEVSIGRFESEGEPSILALSRDVTKRKRAEAEREAAFDRERRAKEHLAFLADASRALSAFLDLDGALAEAARLAVPRVAEWCVVDALEDGGHAHRLAVSFQNDSGETTVRHEDRLDVPKPVREVMQSGRSRLVEEVDEARIEEISTSGEHLERLRSFGLDSYAIVPLRARGRTFGTITFARGDPESRYDRETLSLIEDFASRASLALDNARLYGRQRHTASVLQRSLLPQDLPEIPGIDAAARLHPLGEGIEMGGDFYDLFEASEGRWAVVVGDVLGKGPEAAAATSLARHTLRSVARTEETPSRALASLNAEMLDQRAEGDDRFCTVLFGNIRPSANGEADGEDAGFEIEFASGGHPLPIVLRAGGEVEEVGSHGTLLGVYEDPELFDAKIRLAPGETVVFYTDGVTEARNGGEQFGEERMKEALARRDDLDAESLAGRLEKSVMEFTGGALSDDAAILVVKASDGFKT